MSLHDWAVKHGIGHAAFNELLTLMGTPGIAPLSVKPLSVTPEAVVQNDVRLEASSQGWYLCRNNVGVLKDKNGRPVRYGLANDNPSMNKVLKSGDLIGIRPVLITPQHVGQTIGQFASLECKPANWKYSASEHEKAQQSWIKLILARGGYAKFTTGEL